ncbi:hypothetical protein HYV81_01950 [Candidatus Woesearchaeota archaeon]|nr:hypothetical protein [Candidatus Woesearchaeota archaeon]
MIKKSPLVFGIIFLIPVLIFEYLLLYTPFFDKGEGGFLVLTLSVIFNFPCLFINTQYEVICFILSGLVWFGVGALVGWLVSRKN